MFTLYTEAGVLVDHAWFENGLRHGLTRQFDPETGRMAVSYTHLDVYKRQAMDMSVERVREIQRMAQEPASLESPVGEEEDSSLGD